MTTRTSFAPRPDMLAYAGISKVVSHWGVTFDGVVAGGHLLVVRNATSTAINGVVRPMAVLVPPAWYHPARATYPDSVILDRVPSAPTRATFGRILGEVRTADATATPRHIVVARKMQGAFERTQTDSTGRPVTWRQPASEGVERGVIVGVQWYAHVIGVPAAAFNSERAMRDAIR